MKIDEKKFSQSDSIKILIISTILCCTAEGLARIDPVNHRREDRSC